MASYLSKIKASPKVVEGTIKEVKDFAAKSYKDGAEAVEKLLRDKPALANSPGELKVALIQSGARPLDVPHSQTSSLREIVSDNSTKMQSKAPVGTDYIGKDMPTPVVSGREGLPGGNIKEGKGFTLAQPGETRNLPVPYKKGEVLDPFAAAKEQKARQAVHVGEPSVGAGPSRPMSKVEQMLSLPPGKGVDVKPGDPKFSSSWGGAWTKEELGELKAAARYDTKALTADPGFKNGGASVQSELMKRAEKGERAKKLLAAAAAGTAVGGAVIAGSRTKSPAQAGEAPKGMSGGGEEAPKPKEQDKKDIKQAKASGKPPTKKEESVITGSYNIQEPEDIDASMRAAKKLTDELAPSQAAMYQEKLDALEQEAKDLKAAYKEGSNLRAWATVAEQFGTALAQLGAASYGLRNGINMSGLKFNMTDWDKKHQLALDEYKTNFEEVAGRRKEVIGKGEKEEAKRQSLLEDLFKNQVASSRQKASDVTERNKFEVQSQQRKDEKAADRAHDIQLKKIGLTADQQSAAAKEGKDKDKEAAAANKARETKLGKVKQANAAMTTAKDKDKAFNELFIETADMPELAKAQADLKKKYGDRFSSNSKARQEYSKAVESVLTGRIVVKDKSGKEFTLPKEQLQDALEQGFTLVE